MMRSRGDVHAAMGPGAEFDAIRALIARWGDRAREIGDDAAVLSIPRGEHVIASVDTAIEQRHFRAEWLTPREIGFRAVIAALSDLAAMASRPIGILVALALPPRWLPALTELADGIGDAAAASGTRIVGGNTSAADALSITTTALGTAYTPLRRGGLHDGDAIYVTGQLGGPGAAVAAWRRGEAPAPTHRERFARPSARLHEARWLAERGATAAIDVSDGLIADLQHLAAASGVGLDVDLARVPLVPGVSHLEAASSGEEYELAVGAPADLDVAEFARRFDIPLTRIGTAGRAHDGVVLTRGGVRVANPGGHDHLSS
jgi:thiamine-monophosphate kinase